MLHGELNRTFATIKLMSNDYDFIMNDQRKQKSSLLNGSLQSKLVVFSGIAVVLIVVIVVIGSLLNSGQPSASSYIPVTVYQEELIRILENRDDLSDTSKSGEYTTLYLAVSSDLADSQAYLARNGIQVLPENRTPYYYFDLESDLEAAESANRFDSEFEDYVERAVEDYSSVLINLEPTTGQAPLLEQAKNNIIFYNGVTSEPTEE